MYLLLLRRRSRERATIPLSPICFFKRKESQKSGSFCVESKNCNSSYYLQANNYVKSVGNENKRTLLGLQKWYTGHILIFGSWVFFRQK